MVLRNNSESMRKAKLKSRKRRVLSHRYRNKRISLHTLLHIASLRRKNNVLVHNNRCLAKELQNTRCDMAANSNRVDACAKAFQQVLFAKVKAKDMVNTFTQLVNDLDELTKYLDQINSHVTFSGNGLPCTTKKIPTIESIEEVSALSIDPTLMEDTISPPVITAESTCSVIQNKTSSASRNKSSCAPAFYAVSPYPSTSKNKRCSYPTALQTINCHSLHSSEKKQNLTFLQSTDVQLMSENPNEKSGTVEKNDFEESTDKILPLFPECIEAENKASRMNKNSGLQKSDSQSLTPELEIDMPSKFKRSSKRRQTLFKISNCSKSKSGSKAFEETELPCLVQDKEQLTKDHQNKVDICPLSTENDSNSSKTSNQVCTSESLSNTECKISKCTTFDPSSVVVHPFVSNTTLLLNEDMELTENVSAQILAENNAKIEKEKCMPETKSSVKASCVTKENCVSVKELCKLLPNESNNSIPVNNLNTQSIPVKQSENATCFESPLDDSFNSPVSKRACRKNVKFSIFFSDTSDDEYFPNRLKSSKGEISNKRKKNTAIFIPSKDTQLAQVPVGSCSIPDSSENLDLDSSIFAFNASPSEKNKVFKKSKLSKNKQSTKKKDLIEKAPLRNYNVTKLKGSDYKFTKTNQALNSIRFESFNKQLKSSESSLDNFSSKFLNNDVSEHKHDNLIYKTSPCLKKPNLKGTAEEFKNVLKDTKKSLPVVYSPKSESKRVSFARTDMVCNFKKMSLSKNIAVNRKVKRVSKSTLDFIDSVDKDDKCASASTANIADSSFQFDEETEVYALSLQQNANYSVLKDTQNLDKVDIKAHSSSNPVSIESETQEKIGHSSKSVENESYKPIEIGLVNDVMDSNKDKNKKEKSISVHKKLSPKVCSKKSISHSKNILFPNMEKRKSNVKLYRNSKETIIYSTLDTTARKNIKEINVLSSHKSNTKNMKDISKKLKKNSPKDKQITIKDKKENSGSFLKLKDNMNQENIFPLTQKISMEKLSEGNDLKILPKRRSKSVNYKEPSLNKKMRR